MCHQHLDLFTPDNTVAAEIELVYKSHLPIDQRVTVTQSDQSFPLLLRYFNSNTLDLLEESFALYLNQAGHVLGLMRVSQGGTSSTIVDVKLILVAALRLAANAIILCHNHPSGRLVPSQSDRMLTQQLKKGAELLSMRLLDHLIINRTAYYSMADSGDL